MRALYLAALAALMIAGAAALLGLGYLTGARAAAQPVPKAHRLVILVDSNDRTVMGHAISYAANISRAYAMKSEAVQIEIVANGSGIELLRDDISPLKQPLAALQKALPHLTLSMCDSSRLIAEQKEGHAIAPLPGARIVPFGIGRVMELQEAGWSFLHG
ncbi:hypothetical protein AncyloWKF20_18085 [Ancylobacter sp. WKF20]|uniref:DsrE family protein n=1 Tax=Ancylobacter sp. WKF20 TaxID=3039801 RepID=UPI0024342752|nr:hypothetical protein [Ancylobacter sp. WKF20]WGD29652.1 hypothetical protein AncyloWKF20_18085 [Ancylobacter sp. WKF20]